MRKRLLDRLLLVVAASIVALLGFGSLELGRKYHIPWEWNCAAGMGLLFVWMLGQRLRSKLRQPFFFPFFAASLATYVLGSVIVIRSFPILLLVPFTALVYGIACTFAPRLFRPLPEIKK